MKSLKDRIIQTEKKSSAITANDLFDRVINLKLKVGIPAKGTRPAECLDEYVIRSDYEIIYSDVRGSDVFGNNEAVRKYTIRKCTYKPSIKVQCNMVTANTGTSVDIYISNFFMYTSDGKCLRNFNSADYPLVGVDIAMGYWGQFRRDDPLTPMTLEDFFTVDAPNGADMLRLSSGNIVVTTDKLPPDSTLHIHGYVADITSSPVAISDITDYTQASVYPTAKSDMKLGDVLYECITKRYLRGNRINKNLKSVGNKEDPKNPPVIDFVTGTILDAYAKEYGVKVFLSKNASEIAVGKCKDSDGNETEKQVYFEPGDTISQTIARIQSAVNSKFEYHFTNEGNLLIYTSAEAGKAQFFYKDFEALYEDTAFAKEYGNKLPAVYNVNIDAISTIVCPFFTFIQPFQKIQFASRYALTSRVGFYANYGAGIAVFSAIKVSISFATVDNINEVQISAVNIGSEETSSGGLA